VSAVPTVVVPPPPHPPVLWTDTADRFPVALVTEYTMEKF